MDYERMWNEMRQRVSNHTTSSSGMQYGYTEYEASYESGRDAGVESASDWMDEVEAEERSRESS